MKIGFIGLGLMGSRMAANLLGKGHSLIVYNRSKEKAEELVAKGAILAESPSEVGKKVQIIFTMLSEPDVVEETAFGKNGFIETLKSGSIWIDCSTVNPSFTVKTASKVKQKGIRFLDAPVAGTIVPAEKGELTFFVGGVQSDFEEFKTLLEAMGKKIIYMGENGKGTSIKMVINLLLAQSMAAFSEAMVLGESLGISKDMLLEILPGGPVTAPFITGKKDKIRQEIFEPEFPLKWMLKDCSLALKTGVENNVKLSLTNNVEEIYRDAVKSGLGGEDFSAVYKYLSK